MKAKAVAQYTLLQVSPALDQALRERSRQDCKSINQTAIEVLHTGLALKGNTLLHQDLDFMIGSWVQDPRFDEAIRSQERVDRKLWR
jgi:hypothetical protein